MARTRISTTVDHERLERARSQSGLRDSELFDSALESLIRQLTIAAELAALDRFPYRADPELAMGDAPSDTHDELAYDGVVPASVIWEARRRRGLRPAAES